MSIKQCAILNLLLVISLFSLPPPAQGGQMAILRILLNQEDKGELIVYVTEDGDYLIRTDDLRKMGFIELRGARTTIEGEEYLSLRSMEGVRTEFDEKKLVLGIYAEPHLLEKKVVMMRYPRPVKVYYPKDTSGFLNYNLTYFAGDSFKYDRTVLTNQLGFRMGDFLLLSDSSYSQRKGEGGRFVRLMSNITYDRREDLLRAVFGDFFASSGDLGSTLNMGGISLSKNYRIDPYFVKFPEISFSGLISLPSEIEIYRDGFLIRRERVSPGGIELRDIPTYIGSGLIEIVLKDPFGREQRVRLPYYYSDRLLKKGLHEFSYNLGFEREDFGVVSNRYKNFSFLGFHRYGLSNTLTVGMRGEAMKDVVNMGVSATYLIPKQFGVIDASLAWSGSKGREDGLGGSIGYLYQDRRLSFNLLLKAFTRDYSNISLEKTTERIKYEVSAGGGYTSEWLGSFSINVAITKKYQGTDSKSLFTGYSRKITDRSNIFANFKRDFEGNLNEFMIGVNYYFDHGIMASASHQRTDGTSSERIQVIKNLPMGEGFGGRASYERVHGKDEDYNNFNLQLQYNAKYGQYGGEFISTNHVESYSLTASGALTFVKDSLNITRPIQDSFALVKVGDLKGVGVNLSNQEIGRTGRNGKVLIPNLNSYYDNQISINDKDVPMEYTLSEVTKYVSPPLRSGSYIEFGVTKIQGFVGLLKVKVEEKILPVEYIEFKLLVDGKEIIIPTGKGGEFYFENIKPGRYKGEFKYLDKHFIFDIMIPKSDEVVVELGEVLCE